MTTVPSQPSKSEGDPEQKMTLFCFECGHESPVDGDWVCRSTDSAVAYHCPNCGTKLTERSSGDVDEQPTAMDRALRRRIRWILTGIHTTVRNSMLLGWPSIPRASGLRATLVRKRCDGSR